MKIEFSPALITDKEGKLRRAAAFFRSINNATRKRILVFLAKNPGSTVTKIRERLNMQQSVVSHHLLILKETGLVRGEREGKFIKYSTVQETVCFLHEIHNQLIQNCIF